MVSTHMQEKTGGEMKAEDVVFLIHLIWAEYTVVFLRSGLVWSFCALWVLSVGRGDKDSQCHNVRNQRFWPDLCHLTLFSPTTPAPFA